eukprot:Gregarina_sp_Pseudo_9__383@NODE_124_length_4122_cov_18_320108_g116_i0_p1_GENE_NODE_124_length_4122_cov_18_320108_g116_i0NODE_124_length_4122_cov_18_320108_g116_i0_p1_ORF_typecomplete_len444_score133_97Integrin_beta/PF00362_18/0_28Integrin_beta/PF00362_18/7_3Cornifin/PF02389_15/0_026_NODE_124_length_4122_cov_18_320108_g116_i014012732
MKWSVWLGLLTRQLAGRDVELLVLFENTAAAVTGLYTLALDWTEIAECVERNLSDAWGEAVTLHVSVSSFTDKAIPCAGRSSKWGNGGAWISADDYCLRTHLPLDTNPEAVRDTLLQLYLTGARPTGGDQMSGALEALLWLTHTLPHTRTLRAALVFTQHLPHLEGDGWRAIHYVWNAPRRYDGNHSTGGFGSHTFLETECVAYRGDDVAAYTRLADLNFQRDTGVSLDAAQQAEWAALDAHFGPERWPEDTWVTPHPGEADLCDTAEYPALRDVGAALRAAQVAPVFLLSSRADSNLDAEHATRCAIAGLADDMECVQSLLQSYVTDMGVIGSVAHIDIANLTASVSTQVTATLLEQAAASTQAPEIGSTQALEIYSTQASEIYSTQAPDIDSTPTPRSGTGDASHIPAHDHPGQQRRRLPCVRDDCASTAVAKKTRRCRVV